MLLAAGLGTRLKPFTESHPKALAMVNGKTLLQRNIEYLKGFGINDFIINVHHFPEQIISHLRENKNFGANIAISDETEALLETGGGLKKASPFLKGSEPFLLMNIDILTNLNIKSFLAIHEIHKPLVTLAVTDRETSRYFLFDNENILSGWINTKTNERKVTKREPDLTPKAFSGVHIMEPSVFDLIKHDGKFSIVDLYMELSANHKIFGYDHSKDILIDVGKPESIAQAEKIFT